MVLERLLGEPKTKAGNQYRYGTHQGSLVVTVAGDKRGSWYDFQTGQGGHLLKLIAVQRSLDVQRDFQAVLQEALKILGTSPAEFSVQTNTLTSPHPPSKIPPAASKAPTPEQQRSLRYAQQLARESQPVAGTLAERYLREHRGIALESFPDSVRFHPGIYSRKNEGMHPALLVVAKDSEEKVQAVQAIFLDKETAKKADVSVKKQTWGRPSQGSVALAESAASRNITYLAEGAETALSVYTALNGADVRVTLGKSNFKNIDPAKTNPHIVLCLDNDGQNPQSDKLIHTAVEKLREQGKQVWIAQPAIAGQDYNDVLLQQGQAAVKEAMEKAVSYADYGRSPSGTLPSFIGKEALESVAQNFQKTQQATENQIDKESVLFREAHLSTPSLPTSLEKIEQKTSFTDTLHPERIDRDSVQPARQSPVQPSRALEPEREWEL